MKARSGEDGGLEVRAVVEMRGSAGGRVGGG